MVEREKTSNNLKFKVNKDKMKLLILIDLTKECGPSSSGKTILIAKSGGFKPISGTSLKANINVMLPNGAEIFPDQESDDEDWDE